MSIVVSDWIQDNRRISVDFSLDTVRVTTMVRTARWPTPCNTGTIQLQERYTNVSVRVVLHGPSVSADNDGPCGAVLTDFGTENPADEYEMSD